MENIEDKIKELKKSVLDRYDQAINKLKEDISNYEDVTFHRVIKEREILLKELDDRIALIKQFPSVLDADLVSIKQIQDLNRIEFHGSSYDFLPMLTPGKWKIVILAKKVD